MSTETNHHMNLLPPPAADEMSGAELNGILASRFPDFNKAESLAYVEGAGRALMIAGMQAADVSEFLTDWSGSDPRMYVGLLYGIADVKTKEFANTLVASNKLISPSPGMTQ